MIATGVPRAVELNKANVVYGISQALLQSILDFLGTDLFPLSDGAAEYAKQYARTKGRDTPQFDGGVTYPEANVMAMAWYLVELQDIYGGSWTPVALYFGDGPVGQQKAARVQRLHYPLRQRAWA